MTLHNILFWLLKIWKLFMVLSANAQNFNNIPSCKTSTLLQFVPDHTLDLEKHFWLSNCQGDISSIQLAPKDTQTIISDMNSRTRLMFMFLARHRKVTWVVLSPYISIMLQFPKNSSTKPDIHKEAHPPTYEGDLRSNCIGIIGSILQNKLD